MKKGSRLRKRLKALNDIFRFGSIQSIITLSFAALTILAMFLIGLAFFSTFSENAENNAATSTLQIMKQTKGQANPVQTKQILEEKLKQ